MYESMNPLDEYIKTIKQNSEFIRKLLSPQVSVSLLLVSLAVLGVLVIARF